ncbi:hypothetical protein RJT34_12453 [Clitoria ternatea]|uniref:Uncharacterized protein n=1 Tax=Clitoria ternatea TaxID=43366 RepID=A0AAN9JNT2_CLITE
MIDRHKRDQRYSKGLTLKQGSVSHMKLGINKSEEGIMVSMKSEDSNLDKVEETMAIGDAREIGEETASVERQVLKVVEHANACRNRTDKVVGAEVNDSE